MNDNIEETIQKGNKCFICKGKATYQCGSCKEWFCIEHFGTPDLGGKCQDCWDGGEIIKPFTLESVNERLDSIFKHLKDYCNCEDSPLDVGCALQHKITGYIYCFKDYDMWRGRGNYSECKRVECEFYCFVDPRQLNITKFFDFESQYPNKRETIMKSKNLLKYQEYTINKLLKHLKKAVLFEEFEFEGKTIYIFDPVIKHANLQLYIITNRKEITKDSFGREWMETTRNKFNVVLLQFVIFDKLINLTTLIDIVSIKIAQDMIKRREIDEN